MFNGSTSDLKKWIAGFEFVVEDKNLTVKFKCEGKTKEEVEERTQKKLKLLRLGYVPNYSFPEGKLPPFLKSISLQEEDEILKKHE